MKRDKIPTTNDTAIRRFSQNSMGSVSSLSLSDE